MSDSEQKLRQALMKIAEAAQAAVDNGQYVDEDNGKNGAGRRAFRALPCRRRAGRTYTARSSNLPGRLAERPQNRDVDQPGESRQLRSDRHGRASRSGAAAGSDFSSRWQVLGSSTAAAHGQLPGWRTERPSPPDHCAHERLESNRRGLVRRDPRCGKECASPGTRPDTGLSRHGHPAYPDQPADVESPRFHDGHGGQ